MLKFFGFVALCFVVAFMVRSSADSGDPNATAALAALKEKTGIEIPSFKIVALANTADDTRSGVLVQKVSTYSRQAISASNFLESNLTLDGILFSGKFSHVEDDICHISALENIFIFGRFNFNFNMSDIDVNSLVMKHSDSSDMVNVNTVKGKYFKVSTWDDDKKRWGRWELLEPAAFVAGSGSNAQAILKALDVLAVECGAPEGF